MSTVRILLVVLGTCSAASLPMPGSATTQTEYTLEIPRQALVPAIRAFSAQTDLRIGFFPESPADEAILVGPVHGTFSADAALMKLLQSNGLMYEWINDRSIHIFKPKGQPSVDAKASAEAATPPGLSAKEDRRSPSYRKGRGEMEFVVVIGTRLSSLETESQSVAVLNRRKIESYGVSTLAELFEYLPQIPFMRSEDYRTSGEQYVDLRGLGPGTTLILINGRRVAGSATSFDTGGFDVNTIPLTAVQRVEVLLDSPSIAVGTDAIGGVINILLKDEIPQPTIEVRYGAADGGAEERRLSLGIGTSREAFHGAATLDVFQRDHLLGAERDLSRDQDYRRFGSSDLRSLNASPGNIFSVASANLPGLDTRFAAVPAGSTGVNLTPQDFTATAGQLNRTSLARFRSIVPEVSRVSLVASGELKFSADLSAFAELLGTNKRNEFQIGPPTLSGAIVPASNAFNPFGTPVAVNTLLEGMDSQTAITDADLIRVVTGVRGKWNRWEGEISAAWISEHAAVRRENELDPNRVMQALAASDPGSALNIFRDGPPGSPALLASLTAAPRVQKYSSDSAQGYARVQGPLLALPAGEMMAMFGSEWRREELSNPAMPSSPHRTVSAVFAEVQAPLVRTEMSIPGIQQLSFSVGVRGDDYGDAGTRLTPQYGLVWRPVADIKFRASYNEGYRTPSLYELHASRVSAVITIADPQRRNEVATFVAGFAGNPDLVPSSGRSWTFGLDLVPHALPNFRLSAGYWRTVMDDRIAFIPLPTILAHEDLFPGRVARAERTAADLDAGVAGTLRSVDSSAGNFGHLKASGVDLNAAFLWDTRAGRFTPNLAATWYETFATTLVSGLPTQERVGIASEFGTIPEWSAVASVGWSRGPLAAFLAAQFISAYEDASFGEKNGRTIPSQVLFDAQGSLQLGALVSPTSVLNAVKLTAGVTNVLDTEPQFSELGIGASGYDPSQSNPKQRFWYVRLGKEF